MKNAIKLSSLLFFFFLFFVPTAHASYDDTFTANGDSCLNFNFNQISYPYPRFDFIESTSGSNNMVSVQLNPSGINATQYQYSESNSASLGTVNVGPFGSPSPILQLCQNDNKLLYYKNGELKGTLNYVWTLPLSSVRVRHEGSLSNIQVVEGFQVVQPPNDPPQVSSLTNTNVFTVDEYSANGSFSDGDYSTSWTATVDYGDGSGVQNLVLSGNNFNLHHTYQTGGTFTVTVSVTDNQGLTGTSQAEISVTDIDIKITNISSIRYYSTQHPIIFINEFFDGIESTTCSMIDNSNNTSVDNNAAFASTENFSGIMLSLGLGEVPQGWNSSKQYHLECVKADNTTLLSNDFRFFVAPTVVDVVQNDNLIDVYFTPNNESLPESWLSAQGWFDDLGYGTCEYNVNHNNQTLSVCHLDLNVNPQLPNTNKAYLFSGGTFNNIEYGVESTMPFRIASLTPNVAPTLYALPDATIDTGDTYSLTTFILDNGSSMWDATVDFGDGTGENPITFNAPNYYDLSLNHTYTVPGTHTITVRITDEFGLTGVKTATVTVNPLETPTPTPTPEPVTVSFNASGDAYVKSGQDNHNYGAGTFMNLQSSGSNRSLVKFDQSELQNAIGSGTVLSAKLKLTITDNGNNWGSTGRTVDLHRMVASWDEGNGTENNRGTGNGNTWNCASDSNIANQSKNCSGSSEWEMAQPNNPSVHPWNAIATDTKTITNNQSGVVEFDVTNDVAAFVSGSNSNYGWLLKKTNEGQNGQVSFGTRESSSAPQLVVTYQP